MKKPLTPYQMNLLTAPVVEVYQALENEILKQVTRRLKASGEVNITDWHLEKLNQVNLLNRDLEKYLSEVTGITEERIRTAIEANGYEVVKDTDQYMKLAGKDVLPDMPIEPLLESYVNQTFLEMNNFVNQTLITTNFGTSVTTEMYQSIIEQTTAKFSSGLLTFDKALEDTIVQWADKGVPSTFTDRGGHTWSMERYVETVLRSTNSRIYNELRTSRMAEYGVYTVLMTSKANAREACAPIQGKVVDIRPLSEWDGVYPNVYNYGFGLPAGTRGISCGHQWIPFVPGVNENNQPQYDAEEAVEAERIEQGRKEIARRIRKTKKRMVVTEELGSDSHERYRHLLNRQRADMREYVKEHDLRRNYRLEKVYTPKETLLNK